MSEIEKLWAENAMHKERNDLLAKDAKFSISPRTCPVCGKAVYSNAECAKCPKCGAKVCE